MILKCEHQGAKICQNKLLNKGLLPARPRLSVVEDEAIHATCPFDKRSPKTTVIGPAVHSISLRFDSLQSRYPVAPAQVDM